MVGGGLASGSSRSGGVRDAAPGRMVSGGPAPGPSPQRGSLRSGVRPTALGGPRPLSSGRRPAGLGQQRGGREGPAGTGSVFCQRPPRRPVAAGLGWMEGGRGALGAGKPRGGRAEGELEPILNRVYFFNASFITSTIH